MNEIKQCNELERKIRYLLEELRKDHPDYDVEHRIAMLGRHVGDHPREMSAMFVLEKMEGELGELESELKQMTASEEVIKRNYYELLETRVMLDTLARFLDAVRVCCLECWG